MKTISIISVTLFLLVILTSCEKEYGPYTYVPTANFTETNITLKESDNSQSFSLFLYGSKTPNNTNVTLEGSPLIETGSIGAKYEEDFIITPAPQIIENKLTWNLTDFSDESTITFEVTPVHNKKSIEIHKYTMEIRSVSNNISIGNQSLIKFTFNNVDEAIDGYSLGIDKRSLSFTPGLPGGSISDGKPLTLTSTGLTRDIIVTKTENFKFALTNNKEEASDILVIPVSKIQNGNVTFYVFFAPASATTGSKSGQLYIQSYGVKDVRVALRGTQI